jgi:peptidoglycan DL-endopeptidase CwlO
VRPLLLLAGLSACATGLPLSARSALREGYRPLTLASPSREVPAPQVEEGPLINGPGARAQVVDAARRLVGAKSIVINGRRFGDDCTGFVRAAYFAGGVELMGLGQSEDNGVTAIYRFAQAHGRTYVGGRPVAGDLVFFRDTYDLNRDGAVNDGLTHVGIVDEQFADGTVVVLHRVARGVVRGRMHITHRSVASVQPGQVVNDWLRAPGVGEARGRLMGELFVDYATLLPNDGALSLQLSR